MYLKRMLACTAFMAFALSACSKSRLHTPATQAAGVTTPQMNASGQISITNPVSATDQMNNDHLNHVLCENPIIMNLPDRTPITNWRQIPPGTYKLEKIQAYTISHGNNNSYSFSADSENNFTVNVDCNGLNSLKNKNYDRTYTDSNGGVHHDTSTFVDTVSGKFMIGTTVTPQSSNLSPFERAIEVKFKNAKLISAESKVITAKVGSTVTGTDKIPVNPIEVRTGTYILIRVYLISKNVLDIRLKLSYPPDKQGNRIVQYGEGVYTSV